MCVLCKRRPGKNPNYIHSAVVYFTTILTHVVLADKYYIEKLAVFA